MRSDLETDVSARKRYLGRKRRIIGDDSLITTAEKLRSLRDAEKVTRQRRSNGQKKSQKKSPIESEESSDSSSEQEVEVLECI